jgi:predicted Rossmann fold nucleotide-binding protein DprA/Smf involved in DNA uptake
MLLETDLDTFKVASKDFLRTRLDHMSIVTDRKSEDNVVDGQVLALLDENGISLADIISTTGFSEEQVTLSLGRLISSGSATRIQKGQLELYNLVPPPAPLVRKTIPLVPARDDAEAKKRILGSIEAEGSTVKDIIRTARLPREQVEEGLGKLEAAGKVSKIEKAKKELFIKT